MICGKGDMKSSRRGEKQPRGNCRGRWRSDGKKYGIEGNVNGEIVRRANVPPGRSKRGWREKQRKKRPRRKRRDRRSQRRKRDESKNENKIEESGRKQRPDNASEKRKRKRVVGPRRRRRLPLNVQPHEYRSRNGLILLVNDQLT
jgi:hypothetical protein